MSRHCARAGRRADRLIVAVHPRAGCRRTPSPFSRGPDSNCSRDVARATIAARSAGSIMSRRRFLSASEITARLARGEAHFGVTGEDLVREEIVDPERRVELLAPLGFGAANVVVAVPAAWIDVRCMADLADVCGGFRARHGRGMRVATKL